MFRPGGIHMDRGPHTIIRFFFLCISPFFLSVVYSTPWQEIPEYSTVALTFRRVRVAHIIYRAIEV